LVAERRRHVSRSNLSSWGGCKGTKGSEIAEKRRSMNELMKPLVAAAIPLLTALGSLIATGTINAPELSLAITGFVTAIVVYLLRNRPDGVRAWTKAIGAAVTPLVSALIQYFFVPGSTTKAQLATAVVGVLTALLMAYVQNEPDS
jgi:hypothetical protein